MIVKFYAMLREVVGSRQVEVDLPPGSSLRNLVVQMVKRYPGLKTKILDPQGNLYSHIHIYINGRDSTLLDASLDHVLQPDDAISIFPPVGGG
jgi:molybdopterin synthase sulfur carrier subunit